MDIASFHRVLRLSAGHFVPLYHSRMPPARKTAADPLPEKGDSRQSYRSASMGFSAAAFFAGR